MPVKYNRETMARAIRLVREHAREYPSEYAAITAVAGRLGMAAKTLRKWIRRAEVDEGRAAGVTSSESAEIRELRKRTGSWSRPSRSCAPRRLSSRGSTTRYAIDVPVHRRPPGPVRGRADLPRAEPARRAERKAEGRHPKPVVLVRTAGADKDIIADGHHHFLASEQEGEPTVWAYVGHVKAKTGPWDTMHTQQES